jgi:hypothetical protein
MTHFTVEEEKTITECHVLEKNLGLMVDYNSNQDTKVLQAIGGSIKKRMRAGGKIYTQENLEFSDPTIVPCVYYRVKEKYLRIHMLILWSVDHP